MSVFGLGRPFNPRSYVYFQSDTGCSQWPQVINDLVVPCSVIAPNSILYREPTEINRAKTVFFPKKHCIPQKTSPEPIVT